MQQIHWEDRFSVGIREFDTHHKTLFRIINTLLKAQEEGETEKVIEVILDQLFHYTLYHFTAEEAMMDLHEYPELDEHIQEHLELLVRVKEYRRQFDEGSGVSVNSMLDFLAGWLLDHTLGLDQAYGPYLKARGVH